jgi:hypothetical protein
MFRLEQQFSVTKGIDVFDHLAAVNPDERDFLTLKKVMFIR